MKNFWTVFRKIIIPSFVIFNLSLVIFLFGCGDLDTTVTSLIISPTSTTVGVSQSKYFSIIGKNASGNIITNLSPTWSVSGSIGSVTTSGIFTAGAAGGAGSVVASYDTLSASSTVTVTADGWVAGRVTNNLGARVATIKVYIAQNTALFNLSGSDGLYSIANVPAGTYEVIATDQSGIYQNASAEVTVASGETVTQNFTVVYYTNPPNTVTPSFDAF